MVSYPHSLARDSPPFRGLRRGDKKPSLDYILLLIRLLSIHQLKGNVLVTGLAGIEDDFNFRLFIVRQIPERCIVGHELINESCYLRPLHGIVQAVEDHQHRVQLVLGVRVLMSMEPDRPDHQALALLQIHVLVIDRAEFLLTCKFHFVHHPLSIFGPVEGITGNHL